MMQHLVIHSHAIENVGQTIRLSRGNNNGHRKNALESRFASPNTAMPDFRHLKRPTEGVQSK